ncbi:carbohydrate ABC transporter permease [Kineococcus rhizosphaerae]|uniref:Carbohydrate ABC transporter membrane protein 2 (CUT1 family) n=1 Tax=Kineococcus rhizosphaerae TaxID=559628 RepID=A0A2T0R6F7_9ACTN|nr:carbohydrate ABC transporter permease [Kineococcus rhizosphaerae]PRY16779.1 carbohydrate ABC transporter membrane protein 2 (CUT1 family) [Kineococcus rhizosphaerae]
MSAPELARTSATTRKDRLAVVRPRRSRQWVVGRVVTHACILVGVVLSLFPFYWLLVMSTSTTAQIFGYPPNLLPSTHLLQNLRNVVANVDLLGSMLNSFIVAGSLAVLVVLLDSLAAFAFAKYRFPGRNALFGVLLVTFLVPGNLSLVPSFVLMSKLGWMGDLQALIVPGAANAFGIFLLRQFAQASIPDELIESATLDGAGFFRTWWSIAIPMLRGGLAFLGIFTFVTAWNDYIWPLVVLVNPGRQTLQTALAQLNSVYTTDYGMIMAGAVVSVVPLIGIFLIGSRHFISNIAAGALKG